MRLRANARLAFFVQRQAFRLKSFVGEVEPEKRSRTDGRPLPALFLGDHCGHHTPGPSKTQPRPAPRPRPLAGASPAASFSATWPNSRLFILPRLQQRLPRCKAGRAAGSSAGLAGRSRQRRRRERPLPAKPTTGSCTSANCTTPAAQCWPAPRCQLVHSRGLLRAGSILPHTCPCPNPHPPPAFPGLFGPTRPPLLSRTTTRNQPNHNRS